MSATDAEFKHDEFKHREDLIRRVVGVQGFMKLVGTSIDEVVPGGCTLSVNKRPELLQHLGMFHGGVTAFLVDNATTAAAATIMPADRTTLTAGFTLNYLATAMGDKLICRAKVVKPGRTLVVVSADVYCVIDGKEKHTATALSTIALIEGDTVAMTKAAGIGVE
jgi:uncharacterized protein (TIGR00369 family)